MNPSVDEYVIRRLRAEAEAATPDVWAALQRRLRAHRIAQELLCELTRPPAPRGALYRELMRRVPVGAGGRREIGE